MHKLIRLLCYVKALLYHVFFSVIGFFARHFSKKYSNLWLVSERGNDARDNGYHFFKYICSEHPEVNVQYVITDDSADRNKVASVGRTVRFGSFGHYLSYYAANYLASTHVQPCAPDLILYYHLAKYKIKPHGKQIFLQHGITYNEMKWLRGGELAIDLFVCGAAPEYEYIKEKFGHRDGVVRYLGFCRFDNLLRQNNKEKMILLMPTWRGSSYPSGDRFKETAYFKSFQSLINSERLHLLLSEYGYRLVLYPHVEIQKDMHYFSTASDRIVLADKSGYDVQNLLMTCSLLITDYSSVFFDVAYQKIPEIYYQFDREEFRRYHYQEGFFDFEKHGFGEVCENETELLNALERYMKSGMKISEKYTSRIEKFFPLCDTENCRRIFEAAKLLQKK